MVDYWLEQEDSFFTLGNQMYDSLKILTIFLQH